MSLADVRTYFRTRFDGLGYREWEDAFAFDNIPESILHESYHIDNYEISEISQNHKQIDILQRVVIRFFLKGYRNPAVAVDDSFVRLDAIFLDVLNPSNRLDIGDSLRNLTLSDTLIQPLNFDNDNGVMVSVGFNAQLFVCIQT
jgi:hypothetical protein